MEESIADWIVRIASKANQFYIDHNAESACNYITVKDFIEKDNQGFHDFSETPEDELQKMKDTNSMWSIQIYSDTPVGSNAYYAATLEKCVEFARKDFP